MTAPRICGRVLIDGRQSKDMVEGVKIFIPGDQLRRHVKNAAVGDLIWVQEPYHHCLPLNRWSCQSINDIVFGPRFGAVFPNWIKRLKHKAVFHDGSRLQRHQSRATLIVEAIGDGRDGVWCIVRMTNVDVLFAAQQKPEAVHAPD